MTGLPGASTLSYETEFDELYETRWRHDRSLTKDMLLLDHYPYSVAIDLPRGGRWLELGIGTGRVVDFHRDLLLANDATCLGADWSAAAVELSRELLAGLPVEVVQADLRELSYEAGSFDLITLFGTLQALDRKRWMDQIRAMTGWLKAGGRLGFSLHPLSPLELARSVKAPRYLSNVVSARWLRRELARRGLAFSIERHHAHLIPIKLLSLAGVRPATWFGFHEARRTRLTRAVTWLFRRCLPFLTFAHYWVWVDKPAERDAAR